MRSLGLFGAGDGVDGTDLGADAAADAGHGFDAGLALPGLGVLFVGQHDGGAAALDALAAGDALVGIHHAVPIWRKSKR